MLSYRSEVTIARAPDEVFGYFMEPAKQALWSDVPMRKLTEGPLGEGSRMEVTFGMGPLKAVIGLEIGPFEPGRHMGFRSFSGPIRWDGEYRLAATPSGGTEVSQEGRLTFTGLWRLLEPVVGAEISRGEVKELERLKAAVEAG
jgi:uncharacterized protein YndB with AHSA1/START domain